MSNAVKLYTADETDARYLQHNETIDGTYVLNELSLSGTTLTVSMMDPTNDWRIQTDTITLPSGGSSLDTYVNSILISNNRDFKITSVNSGTTTAKTYKFGYNRRNWSSWSNLSITTSTTNSSWTLLGSFYRGSTYEGQDILVKFKSSGDYGGIMISTQNSSSPSETNSGVIGIMTLPANRWGTYSFSTPDSSTFYIYGMSVSNVSVKRRLITVTTQYCNIS